MSKKTSKITCGTLEWADHNVNFANGCFNDCRYCYAKLMAKRFGRATEKTWQRMTLNPRSLMRKYGKMDGRIMFPSSHDLIDVPELADACLTILGRLLESKNSILVTTKPRLSMIKKIDSMFKRYKHQLQFRFTITSRDDRLLKFWEPNAPSFYERMLSLKYAFVTDYRTSVSIEPFLDHDPMPLVEMVMPYTTESIWLGKMNYIRASYIPAKDREYYTNVRGNYRIGHLKELYKRAENLPKVRFKDSIRIALEKADSTIV